MKSNEPVSKDIISEMTQFIEELEKTTPRMVITIRCYIHQKPNWAEPRPIAIATMPSIIEGEIHKAVGHTLEQVIKVLHEIMETETQCTSSSSASSSPPASSS